jgi:lipopolysaccharide biosynthesis glycosyltransferase
MKISLNVFFTIDESFITHFAVTLISLLENNRDIDLEIYVIHDLDNLEKLDRVMGFFKNKYQVTLHLLALNNSVFETFKIDKHLSRATYFRLLIADIIPPYIKSGLYIDSDIIVTGSLNGLAVMDFNTDLNDAGQPYFLMAVPENDSYNQLRLHEMGLPVNKYFNAGVLFINFEAWRTAGVSKYLVTIAQKFKEQLLCHDQDVLNIYFMGKWNQLDYKYNSINLMQRLQEVPLIIHYAGSSKPWQRLNNHPYKTEYFKYFKKRRYKYLSPQLIFIYNKILRILNWGSAFSE